MTITLSLEPQEEARLTAAAEAKGISTETLVREAINPILTQQKMVSGTMLSGAPSIWDIFEESFKDIPPEEFAKLPTDGASEHDHYLYGHAKRHS